MALASEVIRITVAGWRVRRASRLAPRERVHPNFADKPTAEVIACLALFEAFDVPSPTRDN